MSAEKRENLSKHSELQVLERIWDTGNQRKLTPAAGNQNHKLQGHTGAGIFILSSDLQKQGWSAGWGGGREGGGGGLLLKHFFRAQVPA